MDDERKYYRTRQLIDYNEVVSRSGQKAILCVDSSILPILRKLVSTRGLWRTSYFTARNDDTYIIPSPAEFSAIDNTIGEFLAEGINDMSCDIVDAIRELKSVVAASACCSSTTYNSATGRWGGEGLTAPTTFGGTNDEFATEQDWLDHRCSAANSIVDGLIASCNNLAAFNTLQSLLGVGVLVAVPFMSAPPAGFFIALGVALGASFGLAALGVALANEIADNRAEYVCAIYSSDLAVDAYDNLAELVESAVVSLGFGAVGLDELVALVMGFVSVDVLNQVYTNVGLPAPMAPVDCLTCPRDCLANLSSLEHYYTYGDFDLSVNGSVVTVSARAAFVPGGGDIPLPGGTYAVVLWLLAEYQGGGGECCTTWHIENLAGSADRGQYKYICGAGFQGTNLTEMQVGVANCYGLYLEGSASFTVDIVIGE